MPAVPFESARFVPPDCTLLELPRKTRDREEVMTPNDRKSLAKAGAYMGLAFILPIAMYAGYWAGDRLDQHFQTRFWYVIGILVGFAAGLYELIRQSNRIERRKE